MLVLTTYHSRRTKPHPTRSLVPPSLPCQTMQLRTQTTSLILPERCTACIGKTLSSSGPLQPPPRPSPPEPLPNAATSMPTWVSELWSPLLMYHSFVLLSIYILIYICMIILSLPSLCLASLHSLLCHDLCLGLPFGGPLVLVRLRLGGIWQVYCSPSPRRWLRRFCRLWNRSHGRWLQWLLGLCPDGTSYGAIRQQRQASGHAWALGDSCCSRHSPPLVWLVSHIEHWPETTCP